MLDDVSLLLSEENAYWPTLVILPLVMDTVCKLVSTPILLLNALSGISGILLPVMVMVSTFVNVLNALNRSHVVLLKIYNT